MKPVLTSAFLLLFCAFAHAQVTYDATITHGGLTREYRLYVPSSYSPGTAAPLVFNLHGYGSDNLEQELYGDFRDIADTAGFLIALPNGTLDGSSKRYWNAGFGTAINDVGFIEALIDSISADYNIDPLRIYSTGMSNGGFMSYHLACNSDRFAAIASVTGSMSTGTYLTCSPSHSTPVMEIHGTDDPIVPYTGSTGIKPIADVIDYWVGFNNNPTPPTITAVPDIVTSDMATAEHHVYDPGDNGVTFEHYKIINGEHTWPGAPVMIGTTCMDFSASQEIWRFFSTFTLITGRDAARDGLQTLRISPVPAHDLLQVETQNFNMQQVTVRDITGRTLITLHSEPHHLEVDLTILPLGVYLLSVTDGKQVVTQKFVRE